MKEDIILWGAGTMARYFLRYRSFFEGTINIVEIVDSDESKWGTEIDNILIASPQSIVEVTFEKIIITSAIFFDEIYKRIRMEFNIEDARIENRFYFAKKKLLSRYKNESEPEMKTVLNYLIDHRMSFFNYKFAEFYEHMDANINYDGESCLYYVKHNGKKMFMSAKYDTKEKVLRYYRGICMEQDKNSPHAYVSKDFDVEEGDVVVDVGGAEGNFSLDVIDKCSKLYLFETDIDWIKALECTFKQYKEKVVIINKFVSNYTYEDIDTLDNMIDEEVNFIKMDVEGCEGEVLLGAKKIIQRSDKLKLAVCVYHRDNDDIYVDKIMNEMNVKGYPVEGYMWYPNDVKQEFISPKLRRGVVRYEK